MLSGAPTSSDAGAFLFLDLISALADLCQQVLRISSASDQPVTVALLTNKKLGTMGGERGEIASAGRIRRNVGLVRPQQPKFWHGQLSSANLSSTKPKEDPLSTLTQF